MSADINNSIKNNNNLRQQLQYLKVVNLKEPLPDSLSPERAKYNKELMTKTLRGEAPIIGTFIVKKVKEQKEKDDEDQEAPAGHDENSEIQRGGTNIADEKDENEQDDQQPERKKNEEENYDQEYFRRLRSNEIRKRFYLKVAREYNLQEFFDDDQCTAKM